MTTHIIVLVTVPAVILALFLYFRFKQSEESEMLLILLAVPLTPVFCVAYSYYYIWSTASAEQQSELASMVANCPQTREAVKLVVAGGISMGEAETLIFECAEEHLRISASAASL